MIKTSFIILLMLSCSYAFSQDSISFEYKLKRSKYKSISFGMGATTTTNESLLDYISLRLPFYNTASDRIPDWVTGFEFFAAGEFQVAPKYSIKADYSYFIKDFNSTSYPYYEYSYTSHAPKAMIYFLLPSGNLIFKTGLGGGALLSTFDQNENGIANTYKSTGAELRMEVLLNLQIAKTVGSYLSGFYTSSFQGSLKDEAGNELKDPAGKSVDLSSYGAGLRLGVEIFIF